MRQTVAREDRDERVALLVHMVREARQSAHELRNALMAATTRLVSLEEELRGRGAGDLSEDVASVRDDFARAIELTRPPSDDAPDVRTVDVGAALRSAIEQAADGSVRIEGDEPGAPARVAGGAPGLARAVRELLRNAREGDGSSGAAEVSITVSLDASRGMLRIAVIDDGPGLPEHLVRRGPRYPFTTKPGATGLGLVVARRVAATSGGWLELAAPPQGGALVAMVVPLG